MAGMVSVLVLVVTALSMDSIHCNDLGGMKMYTFEECEKQSTKSDKELSEMETWKEWKIRKERKRQVENVDPKESLDSCISDTTLFKFTKDDCKSVLKAKSTKLTPYPALKEDKDKWMDKLSFFFSKLKESLVDRGACEGVAQKFLLAKNEVWMKRKLALKYSEFVEIP